MKTYSILLSLFTIGMLMMSFFASPIPKPQASGPNPCQNGGSCAAGTILQWVAANGDAGTSCDCNCVGGYSGDSCEYAREALLGEVCSQGVNYITMGSSQWGCRHFM